jgi:hypothetical protein
MCTSHNCSSATPRRTRDQGINENMSLLYPRLKNLPFWCVILSAALFVAYLLDTSSSGVVIYSLRLLRNQIIFCTLVLWLLVLPGCMFYEAKYAPNSVPTRSIIGFALVTVVAFLMVCIAFFSHQSYYHRASTRLHDHLYYLSSFQAVPFMGMGLHLHFDLYECDRIGFICQPIYEKTYLMSSYETLMRNTHLVADPTTNTLTLEIDGEIVYTHKP